MSEGGIYLSELSELNSSLMIVKHTHYLIVPSSQESLFLCHSEGFLEIRARHNPWRGISKLLLGTITQKTHQSNKSDNPNFRYFLLIYAEKCVTNNKFKLMEDAILKTALQSTIEH